MLRRFTNKRVIAALSVVAVLAVAGGAYAYFTSTGSGTGQGTVGTAGSWTVTPAAATGTMYPGTGSSLINYTVTNAGSGYQKLAGTTTAVAHDASGNVLSHGTAVSGCLATWFATANTSPAATNLAGGASASGSVTVTMSDSGTAQDACQSITPDITISAS